jgi:exopolysaccharide production protein ExoQ
MTDFGTTIASPRGRQVSVEQPLEVRAHGSTRLLWMSTVAILIAFLLSVHDLEASKHWLKTDKGELNSLSDEEASGRASRQIGFLLLGGVGVVLLARPGIRALAPSPIILFALSVLLLWALLSAVWSADTAITLKRQVVLVCMLLAAGGLIKQFTIAQLAAMALVHSLFVVLLGVAVEIVLHPATSLGGEAYRFAGTLHPNHMGINASLLLLSSLFFVRHRADRRFFLIAAVAVATLLMTKSRTALSSAVVGSLVFVLLAFPRRNRTAMVLFILLIAGVTMAVVATDAFSSLGQTVLMDRANSDPMTLTGRTMIWQFAYDRIRGDWGRMFTGFGYGGFWTQETANALSQRAHFALAEGHNAYLDVMLQLGLVGLALYLCVVLGTLRIWIDIARRSASVPAAFAAAFICYALNHHVAESAMIAPTFPTLVLWSIVGMAALQCGGALNLRGAN